MQTIQEVRRQQQLRTLEQRRLEHTKEIARQRLHSLRAHGKREPGEVTTNTSSSGAAQPSPQRRSDYAKRQ